MRGAIPKFRERLDVLLFNRPVVLHGWIAAWIGCSLEHAAAELGPLLEERVLVRLSPRECRARGWDENACAYRKK
jgi:hypothetical protein